MRRRDPKHLEWIRSMPCCVPGCRRASPYDVIHPHHARTVGAGGSDRETVPLCVEHHNEFHSLSGGRLRFNAKYGIDLAALAKEYASLSGREMP